MKKAYLALAYATKLLHNNFMTDDDLNKTFRALGDTTRRWIIESLSSHPKQSLFELYTRVVIQRGTNQSRQAFSRHLSVLESVGIVEIEWKGTTKFHALNTQPLTELAIGWLKIYGAKE